MDFVECIMDAGDEAGEPAVRESAPNVPCDGQPTRRHPARVMAHDAEVCGNHSACGNGAVTAQFREPIEAYLQVGPNSSHVSANAAMHPNARRAAPRRAVRECNFTTQREPKTHRKKAEDAALQVRPNAHRITCLGRRRRHSILARRCQIARRGSSIVAAPRTLIWRSRTSPKPCATSNFRLGIIVFWTLSQASGESQRPADSAVLRPTASPGFCRTGWGNISHGWAAFVD